MNAMNGVLHSPKELMRFCQTSATKKRLKLSTIKDKTDLIVKPESSDDFKDYAETTMNELLGWYGYEKLDTRDTKDLNLRHFTSNKTNKKSESHTSNPSRSSSTTSSKSKDNTTNKEEIRSVQSPYSDSDGGGGGGAGVGTSADSTGVCRSASPPLATTESNGENGIENKDCSEDNQNIPPGCIVCAWCAKIGMKLFTLRTATGSKTFCSELCFTQCRRASFKKNKICDWCKHVRHTVNYVDFQDGEQQLQFCSNKCLNQYKMNIFCNETKAHLHLNPNLTKDSSKLTPVSKTSNLITPELWLKDFKSADNDNNSVNSFKDSSDSESDLELEDLPLPMVGHPIKRKFCEYSKDNNELNKTNDKQKDNSTKEKSTKESKRVKHSNKVSNNSSRHTSGAKHSNSKHSNSDFGQNNDWSSHESNDKSSSFQSPSYRAHRHSPIPPPVPLPRASMPAPNHNIPLFNGNSAVNPNIRTSAPLNPMAPNGLPAPHMFPRLPGSIGRADHSIRAPLMPSPTFGPRGSPMHSLLGAAHMEMLMRMQSGFAGLRHPLPYPPPAPNAHPFAGLPHLNGVHRTSGSPLIQPSLQTSGSMPTQMYPNLPLMPPISVMVPYPVPIPIPIPIPVPILFPVSNYLKSENVNKNTINSNIQMNISSSNDVTTTSHNSGNAPMGTANTSATIAKTVESVISKLVERKTKANNNQNINNNNNSVSVESLDLRRKTSDNSYSNDIDIESNSDNSRESLPQNLVVSREHRSVGPLSFTPVSKSGYRVP